MTRVLLVEDNAMNADALGRLLTRRGATVHHVAEGLAVSAAARAFAPQVILMDIGLPDIDGLEVTRRLKADPELSAIPVIALTAHATAQDEQLARDAGCCDYATKPVDVKGLQEKIGRLVGA
ncbi:response regulator [Roseospirillum parvum]|uniref:Response regulator receiver domain-containing protein n=1 Tax=Roseospirillum parvum TaxID=83401 RepID=A0A1G8BV09_9PROT|nr:response regulator [Roseospirillum parvum]SDH36992.1 Response regulator receiver domain-containing protein [Roseospirillum parvum]